MTPNTAQEARMRAEQHGIPFVDLDTVAVRRVAAAFLPEMIARRYRVAPIGERDGTPVIALADINSLGDLTAIMGPSFIPVAASPEGVEQLVTYLYGDLPRQPVEGDQRNLKSSDPSRMSPSGLRPSSAVIPDEIRPPAERLPGGIPEGGGEFGQEDSGIGRTSLDDALRSILGGSAEVGAVPDKPRHEAADEANLLQVASFYAPTPVGEAPGTQDPIASPIDQPTASPTAQPTPFPSAPGTGEPVIAWSDADSPTDFPEHSDAATQSNGARSTGGQIRLEPASAPSPPVAIAGEALAPMPAPVPSTLPPPPPPAPLGFITSVTPVDASQLPPPPPSFSVAAGATLPPPPAPPGYSMPPAIDFAAPSHEEPPRGGEAPFTEGPPLAQALVVSGHVSPSDMRRALAGHIEKGESLARYLLNQGLASEEDLVWAMAQEVGLEFIDLSTVSIDRTASMLIPEATARRHMVLPIEFDDGVPVVAMANPTDVFAMDDLRSIMGRNFRAVVATRSQITSFMNSAYGGGSSAADQAATQAVGERRDSGLELETLQAVVEDAPIVRYVNLLILQALNERASDIHIEPTEHRLRIRFRIDGVMHEATSASASIAASVVSRLKVLGEMDITEHRVPQEGRVSLSLGDRQLDLRLAVLPSVWGETVVMRILDKSSNLRSLPELGFLPSNLELYAKAYHQPYGVILVTGPTGAGKTTTLYATLKEVMTGDKAVVTVEDPVEYQLDGATQVQINTKAGLKFSTVLRSILRADPDIVLIGEIRDAETAMIAMEAALSGHLVLSTLHTNTAAATPLRLTEMGIEPFLVTSAVGSVLTQRLARKLCPKCKVAVPASVSDFIGAGYREADLVDVDTSVLYRAVGCRACGGNGYYGRMVLAEVMKMTEEINRLIITGGSIGDIERTAISQGMTTLRRDGLEKAIAGDTTLEEVLRVVV